MGNSGHHGKSVLHELHLMSPHPQLVILWQEPNADTFLSKEGCQVKESIRQLLFSVEREDATPWQLL